MNLLDALKSTTTSSGIQISRSTKIYFILCNLEKAQEQSIVAAVEAAVVEAGGGRDLTISGDGVWLTRGHSSIHGIVPCAQQQYDQKL